MIRTGKPAYFDSSSELKYQTKLVLFAMCSVALSQLFSLRSNA